MSAITSSVQRVGSSSRPVQQYSDIDFDKIPSPRHASAHSRRASTINDISAGPSHLSRFSLANDMTEDNSDQGGFDDIPVDGGYDPNDLPPSDPDLESDRELTPVPPMRRQSRASFAQLSREDDRMQMDDQEEAEVVRQMSVKKAKGKKRPIVEEEDLGIEDEIAQGLEEVERQPDYDSAPGEQDEEEHMPLREKVRNRGADDSEEKQRPKKKARKEDTREPEGTKKPRGRPRKENVLREGTVGLSMLRCTY